MRRLQVGLVVAALAASAGIAAFERNIDDTALDEAIRFARHATEDQRNAFHRRYVFPAGPPPVTSISLVTEFRRVVLAAEERVRFGDHMWSVREARSLLQPFVNTLEIVADLDYHPQNAYATLPRYQVRIVPKEGPEVVASSVNATPKVGIVSVPSPSSPPYYPFPPPSAPVGPGGQPLFGAWVQSLFDATRLDPRAVVLVVVSEEGQDLARVPVDLGSVR